MQKLTIFQKNVTFSHIDRCWEDLSDLPKPTVVVRRLDSG